MTVPSQTSTSALSRRRVLSTLAALPLLPAAGAIPGLARAGDARPPALHAVDWEAFSEQMGDRLSPVRVPALEPEAAARLYANPVWIGSEPALTQNSGWIDAWQSVPSDYVVAAESASDVAATITFARDHGLRLVVRGGGHSYHGSSSAPASLMIWTRRLDEVIVHDGFVPQGSGAAPTPAVSAGAGCTWGGLYEVVTTQAGRYVQGGGCTTVGVAGLIQGGGFGNFSKAYGLAAASLLEAEIVTADGAIRTVNASQEPDLFWALKGGGGGVFGVITRVTLRTHALPDIFGAVRYTIEANTDAAFHDLLDRFFSHYRSRLFNEHWGEQVIVTPKRQVIVEMVFQGLDEVAASEAWAGFRDFVEAAPDVYTVRDPFRVFAFPARRFWDVDYLNQRMPGVMTRDNASYAGRGGFFWTGDGEQASRLWHGMESLWLKSGLLDRGRRPELVDALVSASRIWPVSLHFNKGLAGGRPSAIDASRGTAMNPQVLDAFALAIIAGNGSSSYAAIQPPPDLDEARRNSEAITRAMRALHCADPEGGGYLYESAYDLPDWRKAYWGESASRLETIKTRYDPDGLFRVHHGVGTAERDLDHTSALNAGAPHRKTP